MLQLTNSCLSGADIRGACKLVCLLLLEHHAIYRGALLAKTLWNNKKNKYAASLLGFRPQLISHATDTIAKRLEKGACDKPKMICIPPLCIIEVHI